MHNQHQPRASQGMLTGLLVFAAFLAGLLIGLLSGMLIGQGQQLAAQGHAPQPSAIVSAEQPGAPAGPATRAPAPAPTSPEAPDQPGASAGAEPTIPLPVSRTATPRALATDQVSISDTQATALASQRLSTTPAGSFLSNIAVQLQAEGLELHGDVNDPTGTVGSGPLVVRGTLKQESGNLRFYTTSATVGGAPINSSLQSQIELAVNTMLRDELDNRKVQDFQSAPGLLTVTVVRR